MAAGGNPRAVRRLCARSRSAATGHRSAAQPRCHPQRGGAMARDVDDVRPDPSRAESAAEAVGQEPELEELQRRHRGFVFPATLFTLVFYMALILAAAYAPGFMSTKVA